MMIRHTMIGTIYTVLVKIKRLHNSNADVSDFTTYDSMTNSFSWLPFEEYSYLTVPGGRKGHIIAITLYVQTVEEKLSPELLRIGRKILEREFFPNVHHVSIVQLGKPKLFLKPHEFTHSEDDETEYRPEKIIDSIVQ